MFTLEQVISLLAATNGTNTAVGVSVTAIAVLIMVWRMKRAEARHEAVTMALRAELARTNTTIKILIGVLQERRNIAPGDATAILTNADDPLYQALCDRFGLDELELLAADLGVNAEHLRAVPLAIAALDLKQQAEREGKRQILIASMQRMRPGLLEGLR